LLVEAKPKLAEESYRLPEIFYRQVDKYFPGHVSLSRECVPRSDAGEGSTFRRWTTRKEHSIPHAFRSWIFWLSFPTAVESGPIRRRTGYIEQAATSGSIIS